MQKTVETKLTLYNLKICQFCIRVCAAAAKVAVSFAVGW